MRRAIAKGLTLFAALSAALSLMLFVGVVVLWVRGIRAADRLTLGYWDYRPHPRYPAYRDASMVLILHQGGRCDVSIVSVQCVRGPHHDRAGPGPRGRHWAYDRQPESAFDRAEAWDGLPPPHRAAGFEWGSGRRFRAFGFPDWSAAALAAALPAAWVAASRRRHRRRAPGLCVVCGYDLRATPEAGGALLGRCPECGAVPAKAATNVGGSVDER